MTWIRNAVWHGAVPSAGRSVSGGASLLVTECSTDQIELTLVGSIESGERALTQD